jgi:hypothetical protein
MPEGPGFLLAFFGIGGILFMAIVIKTDRSRIEAYQRCPRSRWLGYEIDRGKTLKPVGDEYLTAPTHPGGYVADKPAFALEIGSGFHKGMEFVLSGLLNDSTNLFSDWLPKDFYLDQAVAAGIAEYEKEILPYFGKVSGKPFDNASLEAMMEAGVDGEDDEEPFNNYTVNEGRALVEALIRVYCAAPAGLAALLEEYEILEVESEMEAPLDAEGSVILMARPDGILRSRRDGLLYVLSFKTTGKWDKRKAETGRYDTEGISQLLAAEHKYGEKFAGIQMVYAVKGYKMQDKFDGLWKVHNGIVRPYMKHGVTSEDDQYAFSYEYINEDGEVKRLGKGWNKVNIWESGPGAIKDWVRTLAEGDQPNCCPDLLDKMVIMPAAFYRDEDSIEEWKREVVAQELRIAKTARLLNAVDHFPIALAEHFPKHRHSCSYPSKCQYVPVCHEGLPIAESGLYKIRGVNHPQEVENANN